MRLVYLLVLLFLFGCVQQTIPYEPATPLENGSIIDYVDTSEGLTTLIYQPMQCELTPWESWFEAGGIQFVTAPTSEEILGAYYGTKGFAFESVERRTSDAIVCQACSVCPLSYAFVLKTTAPTDFIAEGWIFI